MEPMSAARETGNPARIQPFQYPASSHVPPTPEWQSWMDPETHGPGGEQPHNHAGKASAEFEKQLADETRKSFEAGRDRGRQEGRQAEREAMAAAEKAAEELRSRHRAELIQSFAQERDRYLQVVEHEVVKLALAVAARMNMTWDILGSSGKPTISQTDATSTTSAAPQNGYASGSYQGFAIGSDGTVTASYSNGQTEAVGQLALANVTNLEGLSLQGNGMYATTLASGDASIGISGTNGLATIQDSALEQSNVNISAEFSNLIIAQRGFEANSKAITTFDTITQETINMIH
jgi:flagellar hook-basal body protein